MYVLWMDLEPTRLSFAVMVRFCFLIGSIWEPHCFGWLLFFCGFFFLGSVLFPSLCGVAGLFFWFRGCFFPSAVDICIMTQLNKSKWGTMEQLTEFLKWSDYGPFTLYLSYFTQLCRKLTQDTKQRRKTKEKYKGLLAMASDWWRKASQRRA